MYDCVPGRSTSNAFLSSQLDSLYFVPLYLDAFQECRTSTGLSNYVSPIRAKCGTDKSKILTAIVYIADIKRKAEMNRAWDEWVDMKSPPMRACLGVELEPPHIVEIVVTAAK